MKMKGFTLIEMMIAVGIVGILVAIAYPSYTDHIIKSARSEAMAALLDVANRQEQFFADNHTYTATYSSLGLSSTSTEGGVYTLSIALTSGGDGFTVTATPADYPATKDTDCTTLSTNETGARLSTGGGSTTECWGR